MLSRLTKPTVSSQQKVLPKTLPATHRKPANTKPLASKRTLRNIRFPNFDWRVNEEFGYFELGDASPEDDLYIFNTTLVSCEYFHLLEDVQPDNRVRNMHFWTVQYTAFGCDIVSDAFNLLNDKENCRTFIGDKATARIRSNGALFHQYLSCTSLEFHVIRTTGVNGTPAMVGVSFAELKALTKSDIKGLKATLEIIPHGDSASTNVDFGSEKPELRVVVELSVIPNFFAPNKNKVHALMSSPLVRTSNDIIDQAMDEKKKNCLTSTSTCLSILSSPRVDVIEEQQGEAYREIMNEIAPTKSVSLVDSETERAAVVREVMEEMKRVLAERERDEGTEHKSSQRHRQRSISMESTGRGDEPIASPSRQLKNDENVDNESVLPMTRSPASSSYSPIHSSHPDEAEMQDESHGTGRSQNQGESNPAYQVSNPLGDLSIDIIPSGTYAVTIELEQLWMKSSSPLTTDFNLSFCYPPLGIFRDNPVSCRAKRDPTIFVSGDMKRRCAVIYDGAWDLVVAFNQLSDALLRDPIVVEINPTAADSQLDVMGFAKIPFGKLFFAVPIDGVREIVDNVEISRNNRRFGHLHYKLRLEPKVSEIEGDKRFKLPTSSLLPMIEVGVGDSTDGVVLSRNGLVVDCLDDNKMSRKVKNDFASWSREEMNKFREELKEKERAYLQILAQEWSKRDEEREEKTSRAIRDYAALKEKLEYKENRLNEKESYFVKRGREIEDYLSSATFENSHRLEDANHRIVRMNDQHQNEVDIFMVKLESANNEIHRLNEKVNSLEIKVRAKEDEIDRLNSTRSQWPDLNLERRVMQLEEKNASLKVELERIRKERDSYRNEARSLAFRQNQLHHERDTHVTNENVALRSQVMMTQQKKEIRKERESLHQVASQIEAMKEGITKRETNTHHANLSGNSEKFHYSPVREYSNCNLRDREKLSPKTTTVNENSYKKYLNPVSPSRMSTSEIDAEITRLVAERDRYIGTGTFVKTDPVIRNIDNALTRLASDLMARDSNISGYQNY